MMLPDLEKFVPDWSTGATNFLSLPKVGETDLDEAREPVPSLWRVQDPEAQSGRARRPDWLRRFMRMSVLECPQFGDVVLGFSISGVADAQYRDVYHGGLADLSFLEAELRPNPIDRSRGFDPMMLLDVSTVGASGCPTATQHWVEEASPSSTAPEPWPTRALTELDELGTLAAGWDGEDAPA